MTKTIRLFDNNKLDSKVINQKSIFIDKQLYDKLMLYKNKIDNINGHHLWDKAKKLGNEYELIYLPNKKHKYDSIAAYQPLSRSYFKLWEIIKDFDLIKENNKYNILCLAEGPGGFIDAIINFRKQHNIKDDITAITLKSTNKDIPGWKKANKFLQNNNNIKITYGKDKTGDLYNLENILFLRNISKHSMDFITADGGFDFSINFNKQEELSYRIIFCEIVTALSTQKKNGCFVCKIFDLCTPITIKLLYILYSCYDSIYITKPHTSRPANSEKYIVCKKFNKIDNSLLKLLCYYINNWDYYSKNDYKDFLSFIDLPYIFIKKINIFNNILTTKQISNIEKTLSLTNTNDINEQTIKDIISEQTQNAVNWCNKYEVELNRLSCYR
jgi:23S rRNA U2552 (ribose-2'-O)-methylase RlmE/FtsJ